MSTLALHSPEGKKSRFMGVLATVLLHLLVFVICFNMIFINDTTTVLPLMQIEVLEEPRPEPVKVKPEPVKINPKPVNINQPAATGQKMEDTAPEPTKTTELDDQSGDVEVPVEKPIPVIDDRSLYRGMDAGEAVDNASGVYTSSGNLPAGNHDPSTATGDDKPSFDLSGRSIKGELAQPENRSNRDGRVVVEITVNQSGQVIKAQARLRGSTIQDAVLWKAAEDAARKTMFNTDTKSPPLQMGTITYVFKLK
jgi:TonB family protein